MPLNIPNLLTWFRIILIPVFLGVFYLPDTALSLHHKHLVSTVIFALAALTDWLDGYLARALNQTSAFGAFLDPVIIIGREIAISALREWMAQLGESKSTAVSMLGKVKTVFQMIAILLLLCHDSLVGLPANALGTLLIYLAAVLTLWSMIYYLKLALPQIARK